MRRGLHLVWVIATGVWLVFLYVSYKIFALDFYSETRRPLAPRTPQAE